MNLLKKIIVKSKQLKFIYLCLASFILLVTVIQIDRRYSSIEDFNKSLHERLSKIEELEGQHIIKEGRDQKEDISLYIKSLTFRIGTEDDRLRIYWSNGRTTDLPCSEDETIWACG